MAYQFSAPDPNAGNDPSFLGDFLRYKQQSDAQHLQTMKDIAEFQSNLRLNELDKQMRLMRSQPPAGSNLSTLGGSVGRGTVDPYKQLELEQTNQKIANEKAKNDANAKIAQENADTRKTGTETPEQKSQRQLSAIGARGENAENLENTRQTGRTALEGTKETGRENLENVRQGNRAVNIKTRGGQIIDQIKAKGEEARKTKQTSNPSFSGNLPSQELIRRMNAAQQVMNENPDLGKFIKIDPNTKNVTVTQPSVPSAFSFGSSGPTQEQYQQILDKLYPQGTPTMSTQTNQPATNQQPSDPTHVMVQDKDGKKFFWDTTKGAIPQGYTSVGGGGDNQSEEEE